MNMTATEQEALVELVKRMREAQRKYFNTKATVWLNESKTLERQVDRIIESLSQPRLF